MIDIFRSIFKFLLQHGELIIMVVYSAAMVFIALASLIILICKKLKSTDNDLFEVLQDLPGWIKDAEQVCNSGVEKYTYVYKKAIDLIAVLKGIDFESAAKKYSFIIDSSIENILSTPTKKGVINEKNNEKIS